MTKYISKLISAIVGSGPGGLTLARLLQKAGVLFTPYERDSSPDERNQGGSLDLHSVQVALRVAGLIEEFTKLARFEADCTKLVAPDGTVLLNEAEDSKEGLGQSVLDPKSILRDMPLSSLNPGTVQYGVLRTQASQCRALYTFIVGKGDIHSGRNVKKGPFDVVIRADGISSRVRSLLTDSKPFYSASRRSNCGLWTSRTVIRGTSVLETVGYSTKTVLFSLRRTGTGLSEFMDASSELRIGPRRVGLTSQVIPASTAG